MMIQDNLKIFHTNGSNKNGNKSDLAQLMVGFKFYCRRNSLKEHHFEGDCDSLQNNFSKQPILFGSQVSHKQ